jgi:penicillin-binding protein
VESDYFNSKFAPKGEDDSLISGKYVEINGRKYLADDSTPDDFAQKGLMLNPDYIHRLVGNNFTDFNQLIPKKDRWNSIFVPGTKIEENGKSPASVTLNVSGNTLSWNPVLESDIIGYRVYKSGIFTHKVASIKTGSSLTYSAADGDYYVTAVDIKGNESEASNPAVIGEYP